MKRIDVMVTVANLGKKMAQISYNGASEWFCFQTKEPENMEKIIQKWENQK